MSNQQKKIDWSKAPVDAVFYSMGYFRKLVGLKEYHTLPGNYWSPTFYTDLKSHKKASDFEWNPAHHSERNEFMPKNLNTLRSTDILKSVISIQEERAKEYEKAGGERSFSRIAEIFNAYTHKDLKPSDVALIFSILKYVRSEHTTEVHLDSYIDKVSYESLWAELRIQEKTETKDK